MPASSEKAFWSVISHNRVIQAAAKFFFESVVLISVA